VVGIKNEEQRCYLTLGWKRRPLIWEEGKTKTNNIAEVNNENVYRANDRIGFHGSKSIES